MYTAQNNSDVHPTEEHLFAFLATQPKVDHARVAQRRNALRHAMAAALVSETTEENPLVSETATPTVSTGHGECKCA